MTTATKRAAITLLSSVGVLVLGWLALPALAAAFATPAGAASADTAPGKHSSKPEVPVESPDALLSAPSQPEEVQPEEALTLEALDERIDLLAEENAALRDALDALLVAVADVGRR